MRDIQAPCSYGKHSREQQYGVVGYRPLLLLHGPEPIEQFFVYTGNVLRHLRLRSVHLL
jgi:hypothetical protein